MVLWEITLATAYFLGIRRTYRLALKIQRRLISPKRVKIRQFAHRRTRAIFDIALSAHRNIQNRDLEVGRSLGNWILRWLDKMKPSANIRGVPQEKFPGHNTFNPSSSSKQASNHHHHKNQSSIQKFSSRGFEQGSDRHIFSAPRNTWSRSLPGIAMVMRQSKPAWHTTQYRQMSTSRPLLLTPSYIRGGFEGVIRKDIMEWMHQT